MKTETHKTSLLAPKALPQREVKAVRPSEVGSIGHTMLDCIVSDDQGLPAGRPSLFLMIDGCSEMALGYSLSLAAPSSASVGQCIVHAILPKAPTLLRLGLQEGRWPCWGMVDMVHTDLDRKSDDLDAAASEYGFEITYRSPSNARHFLGVGKVLREIADKVNEWTSSCGGSVSLAEVERYIVTWILQDYAKKPKRTLGGKTPLQTHEEGYAQLGAPPMCADPVRLEIDFMPSFRRCVHWYGVKIGGLNYDSEILDLCRSDEGKNGYPVKHLFRRDPMSLGRVWFWYDRARTYRAVPLRRPI